MLTRRQFVERAAIAAAALAVPKPGAAQAGGSASMFISLNGALTRGVSGADKVRLAARTGYGGVDWDFGPARTAGLDATKALFAETKVRPTIVNLPMARPLPFGGEQAAFAVAGVNYWRVQLFKAMQNSDWFCQTWVPNVP